MSYGANSVCVDALILGLLGRGKGSLLSCPVEVFLKEFKRDAVAMYENDPDASMNQVVWCLFRVLGFRYRVPGVCGLPVPCFYPRLAFTGLFCALFFDKGSPFFLEVLPFAHVLSCDGQLRAVVGKS